MRINKDWTGFKQEAATRYLKPQFIEEERNGAEIISIFATDGAIEFICEFSKVSDEYLDFNTNFRTKWNKQLDYTDSSGIMQVAPSSRPAGTATFFTGEGDNGIRLIFELSASDVSISRDMTFGEGIYVKDGTIFFENAPSGASFSVEVVHPVAGVVVRFCKKALILGTGQYQLNSEDKSFIPQGLILRITVFNGTIPTDFKAVGSIEGFRTNTLL